MKRFGIIAGLIFWAVLVGAQVTYHAPAYEYDLLGKGGRAAGMGYAFNAVADDATAIHFNPAGIAQMNRTELAIVNRITFTDMSHSLWSARDYRPVYTLDYLGLVLPLKLWDRTLSIGIAYQNKINYKTYYSSYQLRGDSEEEFRNTLTINTLTLCGAYALTPYLNLGASFSTWFSLGNSEVSTSLYRDSEYELDGEILIYDNLFSETYDSRYYGMNLALGALLDLSNYSIPLRLSLKYESIKVLLNTYEDVLTRDFQFTDRDTIRFTEIYGGTRYYYISNVIALGASYRFGDYFTLACDFDYKPFDNSAYYFDGYRYYDGQIPIIDTTFEGSYKLTEADADMHQFRLGMEYIVSTNFGLVPLRAGWKTNPTGLAMYTADHVLTGQVKAFSLNTGFGLIRDHYSIDIAYEFYTYKRIDGKGYREDASYHFLVVSGIYNF